MKSRSVYLTIVHLIMLLMISGCTVGPDFVTPQTELNKNWNEKNNPHVKTKDAVNKQWWCTFNDPILNKLIQQAYQQNLTLQIAGLRIMEARAQLGIAIGQQYPQTQEAFGSAMALGLSKNAPNSALIDANLWNYELGFDAAWELDFWGKYRRNVESAKASLLATTADYDDALVSLTAEVARTYAVIRTFEATIKLTLDNIKLQENGLRITKSRFRNGVVTKLDVTQACTFLESTRATIPKLQAGLKQAQNAMSTLLGQPTGTVQCLLNGPKGIPRASTDVSVGVPAELLRRRPDIRSAELAAAAQCPRIGIAKTDLYPSFSLLGQIGYQTSSGGGFQSNYARFSNLFDKDSLFFSYGPSFQWPILNYGRIENNVRVQDARFQQLLVNYKNTVLKAAQEVEDALTGFLNAQEATIYEQNSVCAAKQSVKIAMIQYREGVVDYQRVLDTQRAQLQEELRLADTQSSVATNLIALYKALGGGWELRQCQPFIAAGTQCQMKTRTNWGHLLPAQPAATNLNPPPPASKTPLLQKPVW